MLKKTLLTLIALSITAGFIAGLVAAIRDIAANGYIYYGLYRIALLTAQDNLNNWLLYSLMVSAALVITVVLAWGALTICRASLTVTIHSSRFLWFLRVVAAIGACAVLLWAANRFVLPHSMHPASLAGNAAIVLGCFLIFLFSARGQSSKIIIALGYLPLRGLVCAVLILWAAVNSAALIDGRVNRPDSPNIVLIVVDCLRADSLGCYGFTGEISPAIDAFAGQGVLFERAYSNAPWTKPSVATLFTALYPKTHGAIHVSDALPDRAVTLAEMLKNNNYSTHFFNGGNYNFAKGMNFGQGFDYYERDIQKHSAEKLTDRFLERLPQIRKKPFFAYVHFMDPHLPYGDNPFSEMFISAPNALFAPLEEHVYIENWLLFELIRKLIVAGRLNEQDKQYLRENYNSQIRYVDANIGRIVSALDTSGLLQDTLVIITSDHGEEFWDHDCFEHGHTLYNELLHIPLVMGGWHLEAGRVKGDVSLVDLAPTLYDMLEIRPVPSDLQGASFLNLINDKAAIQSRPVFATGTLYGDKKFAKIKGPFKLIHNTGDTHNKTPLFCDDVSSGVAAYEFFDLRPDPLERFGMNQENSESFASMKDALTKYSAESESTLQQEAVIDEQLRRQLESIGYIQ